MAKNRYEKLNKHILPDIEAILLDWYPDGQVVNGRFHIGSIDGEEGKSFNVALEGDKAGNWYDFQTAEGGGDLISLYAKRENITMAQAYTVLKENYGPPEPVIIKPPRDVEPPTSLLANSTNYWVYNDSDGQPLTYVRRIDSGSDKQYLPLSYDQTSQDWVPLGYPAPKPLYNLHKLAQNPEKRVLIVEGEKCAEAAASILNGRSIVTTWLGGASAVDKTDWSPLAWRDVTIWPDADHNGVGQKAAHKIAQALEPHGCQVKLVDVSSVKEDKWDIADAVEAGWDLRAVQEWLGDKLVVYDRRTLIVNNGDNAKTAIVHIAPENKGLTNTGGLVGIWAQLGLQLVGGNNPNPAPNAYNLHRILESDVLTLPDIWYDTFENHLCTQYPGEEPRKLNDADVITILRQIQGYLGMHNVKQAIVWEYMSELENTKRRNWAADWIKGLKWDGVARIRGFFRDVAGAPDNEYVLCASENWWVSLAARICRPGCQVDTMPILEGKQGVGKSRLLRIIGGRLHSEIAEGKFDEKEIIRGMNGKAIIEFGELHAMRKADVAQLKSFLTRTVDTARGVYARMHKDIPRHCVFVGTTNEDEYFIDATGNRRFWPIATDKIEEGMAAEFREQYYAEAYHLMQNGHQWWDMPVDRTVEEQLTRVKSDAWTERVEAVVYKLGEVFTMSQVFTAMDMGMQEMSWVNQSRVGQILKRVGYRKTVIRVDGKQRRVWTALPETASHSELVDGLG